MHQAPARKTSAAGALCVPGKVGGAVGRSKQLVVQRGWSARPVSEAGQMGRSDGPGQSRARILSSEVT